MCHLARENRLAREFLRNQSQKIILLKINIFIYGEYTIQVARLTKRLALDIRLGCVKYYLKC